MENDKINFNQIYRRLSIFYLLFFLGIGSLYPLLSSYYFFNGMSGKQIGVLMSIGPIIAIISQPIWGMICDRYGIQKKVLFGTLLSSAAIAFFFPITTSYILLILLSAGIAVFQSAVIPISDNISMNFVQTTGGNYGNIRLWGSIGFAVAVWIAGNLAEYFHIQIIFYLYAGALIFAALLTKKLPDDGSQLSVEVFKGIRQLFKIPTFTLFLVGTFLLFGTMNANNTYFSIYFQEIGGTLSGVGLAFLLAAGSEAPVMMMVKRLVDKFGLMPLILFATIISAIRWYLYSTGPSTFLVLATSFTQGLSIGIYLPAAVQFVREIAPKDVQVTAMSLYGSFGLGLGSLISVILSGVFYDLFGSLAIYKYYMISSLLALVVFSIIYFMEREKKIQAKQTN